MCGGTSNYRTPSLFVGWLSVVSSILAVFYYTYLLVKFNQKREENSETEESVKSDFQPIFDNGAIENYILLANITCTVLLCFIPSILLVKGIKQNRRKLVVPWLYIAYVSLAVNCIHLIFMIWDSIAFTDSLGISLVKCFALSLGLIFWFLCIYPVRKFYKIMSINSPILPTQYVMVTKKPEDHQHYMPLFEN